MDKDYFFDHRLLDLDTQRREVGPDVFMLSIVTDSDTLSEDVLLAVRKDAAVKLLGKEAAAVGYAYDGFLYYAAPYHYMVPLYELLCNHIITDYDIIRRFDPHELYDDGQYFCSYYFGELKKAGNCRDAGVKGYTRVSNGLDAFEYIDGVVEIAIHETAAYYELSDEAQAFGIRSDRYLYYHNETCAIPLYELTDTYPSLRGFIGDEKNLVEILRKNYPVYLIARGLYGQPPDTSK